MRTACITLVFGLLITTLSHARLRISGAGDTLSVDTTGFPAEMQATYALMTQKCSRCHTIERIITAVESGVLPLSKQRFGADTTETLVGRMFVKPDANITRGEARRIAELLSFLLRTRSEEVAQEPPPPEQKPVVVPPEPAPEPKPTIAMPAPTPEAKPEIPLHESPPAPPTAVTSPPSVEAAPVVTSGHVAPRNVESQRVASLRQLAEAGDRDGQVALGWLYSSGDEVPRDKGEAARWYRLAAEQGDIRAQLALGWLYYAGDGVKRDLREAAHWYEKAAAQGNGTARKKFMAIRIMLEQEKVLR